MIELEIQGLSESRDGLLIEVGRSIVACGFTLQRQRLTQDPNGVLLTMVVRGPARKQRVLEAALDANERLISAHVYVFEEGSPRLHYAAARTFARPPVPPAPPPPVLPEPPVAASRQAGAKADPAPRAEQATSFFKEAPVLPAVPARESPAPLLASEPAAAAAHADTVAEADPDFVFIAPRAQAPAPVVVEAEPYVEIVPLGPDEETVEKIVPKLLNSYPQIFHSLHTLEDAVAPGARESSLQLAGRRTGAWVWERDHQPGAKLGLDEAMERIGLPALRALAQVEYANGQLRIRNSPLCKEGGPSSCQFFIGYLEGLLAPVLMSGNLSTFPLGCCSYGGDACVLAISA